MGGSAAQAARVTYAYIRPCTSPLPILSLQSQVGRPLVLGPKTSPPLLFGEQ